MLMAGSVMAGAVPLGRIGGLSDQYANASIIRTTATPLLGTHVTLPSGRRYWFYNPNPSSSILVMGLPGTALDVQNVNDTFWVTGDPATTGWQQHARGKGYTLALCEEQSGWNVGGQWTAGGHTDMTYLVEVYDDAAARMASIANGYIAGFSAGGAMAFEAHVQHPELWQACAMASGWAGAGATDAGGHWTYPAQDVFAWDVHGTGDTTVPIRGGIGTGGVNFAPAFYGEAFTTVGSRYIVEATTGGHGTAGWMADRCWTFFTNWRFKP
jgi:poly(3-hydroxybutyrate) depolymerase